MKNLKKLRKEANKTQYEMSEFLRLSLRGYQAIENQIHETTFANLIKIADYFNCSIDYLLGHETKEILHLDSFTKSQQKAIELIKKLDDDRMMLLLGYLARMTDTPLDEILSVKV